MRSSKAVAPIFTAVLLVTAAAQAAHVDMKEPRRALGREDDVRVDAQLLQDTISTASPISVTYEVQNLSSGWIAVADKVATTDFDADTRTITLAIGAEVPRDGVLPHLVMIAPGERKTFSAGATAQVAAPNGRSPFAIVPRYVQITVNFLRDINPFRELIARQAATPSPVISLSDRQFDQWLQSNDSVVLNSLPVAWNSGGDRNTMPTADQEAPPSDRRRSSGTWE
jgi:hypothetical protein